jgi:hypothetical protein
MAERYSAETTVPEWHARLVCSQCGSRRVDMVVSGTARRQDRPWVRQDAVVESYLRIDGSGTGRRVEESPFWGEEAATAHYVRFRLGLVVN